MAELIKLNAYPVKDVLSKLLTDKTTGKNIVFATDNYAAYGCRESDPITANALLGFASIDIQPRILKNKVAQSERTRKKAEVFTPSWITNKMNNFCDAEWFWYKNVFNCENGTSWRTNKKPARFPMGERWQDYVDSRRLEITCGEAPYIVSRYDTTTGKIIDIDRRIGILDRKLRVVGENTDNEQDWLKWAVRAVESVYGYELQGDSLLIARINVLSTFCDYLKNKWHRKATLSELCKVANIVTWNFWQMDGLTGTVPFTTEHDEDFQISILDKPTEKEMIKCKVYDWRSKRAVPFEKLKERGKGMKFDHAIGNPPYQVPAEGNKPSDESIYHEFMDAAFSISDKVELITPARFLFNGGNTPSKWNQERLSDEHFKVLEYEPNSKAIFPNADVKGGIAITYRDVNKNYGEIGAFTVFSELNSILKKVQNADTTTITNIIINQNKFNLENLYKDYPNLKKKISSNGKEKRMTSGCLSYECFFDTKQSDNDICILGVINNKRQYKYIDPKYIEMPHGNIKAYKVIVPANNGSGDLGETISSPLIGEPFIGYTQTFIGIGSFDSKELAENALKYVKSKFARVMLGILKITQNGKRETWKYVPLPDFSKKSDIDWTRSIPEIDKQLYAKYGLSQEEIDFIEMHGKEMK